MISLSKKPKKINLSYAGFTIIEIIIVILILAIIAVVIFNSQGDLSSLRSRQVAYKIKSDIRFAQSYAIATQNNTRIGFDVSLEGYSVYTEVSPESWTLITDPLKKTSFSIVFDQDGFAGVDLVQTNLGGTNYGLMFDSAGIPYGYSPEGSSSVLTTQGTITLSDSTIIYIEPQTGEVSLN